ncbi:cobalt-factor II C(20)-methyltransferase [Neisseria sp. Ec49-e6-T10]|uniref:cobalt-factor II C(20)-methyltransferase n=1 Tax=Neisseria sp. Ec49-e6-T10 TaxID=3140744 RepID=UPI003EB7529B
MSGKLFAIGTGPGSPDLITVRGARILGQVDILYAPAGKKGGDSLALSIVREYLTENVQIKERHFPMSSNTAEKVQVWDEVTQEIVADVAAGKKVAFVSLGDVMLYSTWVSILERLPKIDMEIIPGITSFALIAARCARPLAMDQQSLAVLPCTAPEEELDNALKQHSALVLMKAASKFVQVRELLAKNNLLEHAVLVSDASLESEKQFRDLREVGEDEKLPYFTTIIVNKEWQ